MSTQAKRIAVEVVLDYRTGADEPEKGIYRNAAVPPEHADELGVAVRSALSLSTAPYNAASDGPPQIQLVGTARSLEELGRFLIALARLETQDPEPYGWLDDVRGLDGGTARVVVRRVSAWDQRAMASTTDR